MHSIVPRGSLTLESSQAVPAVAEAGRSQTFPRKLGECLVDLAVKGDDDVGVLACGLDEVGRDLKRLAGIGRLHRDAVDADLVPLHAALFFRFGFNLNEPLPTWTTRPSLFFDSEYRTE